MSPQAAYQTSASAGDTRGDICPFSGKTLLQVANQQSVDAGLHQRSPAFVRRVSGNGDGLSAVPGAWMRWNICSISLALFLLFFERAYEACSRRTFALTALPYWQILSSGLDELPTARAASESWRSQGSGLSAESETARGLESRAVSPCHRCVTPAGRLTKRLSGFKSSKFSKRARSLPASFAHSKAKESLVTSLIGGRQRSSGASCQVTAAASSASTTGGSLARPRPLVLLQSIWAQSSDLLRRSVSSNWIAKVRRHQPANQRQDATEGLGKGKTAETEARLAANSDRAEERTMDGTAGSVTDAATCALELIQQDSPKVPGQPPVVPDVPPLGAQPRQLTPPVNSLFRVDGAFSSPVSAGVRAFLSASPTGYRYPTVTCRALEARASSLCSDPCAVSDSSPPRGSLTDPSAWAFSDIAQSSFSSPAALFQRGASSTPRASTLRTSAQQDQSSPLARPAVGNQYSCSATPPGGRSLALARARTGRLTSDEETSPFPGKGLETNRVLLRQSQSHFCRALPGPREERGTARVTGTRLCSECGRRPSNGGCACCLYQRESDTRTHHLHSFDSLNSLVQQCGGLTRSQTVAAFHSGRAVDPPTKSRDCKKRRRSAPGRSVADARSILNNSEQARARSGSPSMPSSYLVAGELSRLEAFSLAKQQDTNAIFGLQGKSGQSQCRQVNGRGPLSGLPAFCFRATPATLFHPHNIHTRSDDPGYSPFSKSGSSTSSSLAFNTEGALLACIDLLGKTSDFQSRGTPAGPHGARRPQRLVEVASCNWERIYGFGRLDAREDEALAGSPMSKRVSSSLLDTNVKTALSERILLPEKPRQVQMDQAQVPRPASLSLTMLPTSAAGPSRPTPPSSVSFRLARTVQSPSRSESRELATPSSQDGSLTDPVPAFLSTREKSQLTFQREEGAGPISSGPNNDAEGGPLLTGAEEAGDKPQWMAVRRFSRLPRTEEEAGGEGEEDDSCRLKSATQTSITHHQPTTGMSEVEKRCSSQCRSSPAGRRGTAARRDRQSRKMEQGSPRTGHRCSGGMHYRGQKQLAATVQPHVSSDSASVYLLHPSLGSPNTPAALAVGTAAQRPFRNRTVGAEYANSPAHSVKTPLAIRQTVAAASHTPSSLRTHCLLRQAASSVPRLPVVGHDLECREYYKAPLTRTRTADPAVVQAAAALALVEVAAETTGGDVPAKSWGHSAIRGALAKLRNENFTVNTSATSPQDQTSSVEPDSRMATRKKMLFRRLHETFSGIPDSWHERSCRVGTSNALAGRGPRDDSGRVHVGGGTLDDSVDVIDSGPRRVSNLSQSGEQSHDSQSSPSVLSPGHNIGGSCRSSALVSPRRRPSSSHTPGTMTDEWTAKRSWHQESLRAAGPRSTEEGLCDERCKAFRDKREVSQTRVSGWKSPQGRSSPESPHELGPLSCRLENDATSGTRRHRRAISCQVLSESASLSSFYRSHVRVGRPRRPGSGRSGSSTSRTSSNASRTGRIVVRIPVGRAIDQSPSSDECLYGQDTSGVRTNRYLGDTATSSFRDFAKRRSCSNSTRGSPKTPELPAPSRCGWRERGRRCPPATPERCHDDEWNNYTFRRRLHILAACFDGSGERIGSESE
ncbi:hypothetical protein CSUI_001063 [Cystoisospora suis]|uniref:Uncharacterized protein n=1 Tax=Cystoisospora suis TaxID=483139 RepID=A0A2C6LE30_9APIC|nr:hypothetical protein CSUI_001063 [Cystoisospora suis]